MVEFAPMESLVTPFMLESAAVRGRMLKLTDVSNTILARYDYPPAVRHMLGELLAVAAMLSATLKHQGMITLQVRGKGLVPLMVADALFGGELRAYAEVPAEAHAALVALPDASPAAIVGEGAYLAITLDAGEPGQRYQGIVALEGDSVAAALSNYFLHSEQREVSMMLSVSRAEPWSVAGLMIEPMPTPDVAIHALGAEASAESWRYAQAMMATLRAEELLDPLMDAKTLLFRLFHEEGVRVYVSQPLSIGCRCSRERIEQLLMSMSPADRLDMLVDGTASVHCQFCNKAELFTPSDLGLSVG